MVCSFLKFTLSRFIVNGCITLKGLLLTKMLFSSIFINVTFSPEENSEILVLNSITSGLLCIIVHFSDSIFLAMVSKEMFAFNVKAIKRLSFFILVNVKYVNQSPNKNNVRALNKKLFRKLSL